MRFCYDCVCPRYTHRDADGIVSWIEGEESGTNAHTFDELHLLGSSHLAFKAKGGDQTKVQVYAGYVYGDKSGRLHAGYNQEVTVNDTDADIPFSTSVYEEGLVTFPPRAFFWKVDLWNAGHVGLDFIEFLLMLMFLLIAK